MSGRVDSAGWYLSTNKNLENASVPTVISEDIHNIEHYYDLHGPDAPTATFLYVSTEVDSEDGERTTLFLRASNMPHTEEIMEKRFTAFAAKTRASENVVATHGYGAVLPPMFVGGTIQVMFKEGGIWKYNSLDIEEQRNKCIETKELDAFSSKYKPLPRTMMKPTQDTVNWNQAVRDLFAQHNICAWEYHENPTYKGRYNLRDRTQFLQFGETLQHQFEDLILANKVRIICVYCTSETSEVVQLPYNFFKDLHDQHAPEWPFPYSPFASTQLENTWEFEYAYANSDLYMRTKLNDAFAYFKLEDMKIEPIREITTFVPQIRTTIGSAPKDNQDYAKYLTGDKKHPMYVSSVEEFAGGVAVNLNGYRMSNRPLRGQLSVVDRNLPFASRTRIRVDILDTLTKQQYIDAKEHKTLSVFKDNGSCPDGRNLVVEAVDMSVKLIAKCKKAHDVINDQNMQHVLIDNTQKQKKRRNQSQVDGSRFETNIARQLEFKFPGKVLEGDVLIKRNFLETTDPKYTGIDVLVEPIDDVVVLIQCKRKERISADDYESFLRTFQYAVGKYSTKHIFGIFLVHKETIEQNKNFWKLVGTPGVNLVCSKDGDTSRLGSVVDSIADYITRSE